MVAGGCYIDANGTSQLIGGLAAVLEKHDWFALDLLS